MFFSNLNSVYRFPLTALAYRRFFFFNFNSNKVHITSEIMLLQRSDSVRTKAVNTPSTKRQATRYKFLFLRSILRLSSNPIRDAVLVPFGVSVAEWLSIPARISHG